MGIVSQYPPNANPPPATFYGRPHVQCPVVAGANLEHLPPTLHGINAGYEDGCARHELVPSNPDGDTIRG